MIQSSITCCSLIVRQVERSWKLLQSLIIAIDSPYEEPCGLAEDQLCVPRDEL